MKTIEERYNKVDLHEKKILFTEILIGALSVTLFIYVSHVFHEVVTNNLILIASVVGVIPVVWRALSALLEKRITIDLLASTAVITALLHGEILSAVFINLMLASAELFELITARKTSDTISQLLKLRPSVVRVKKGETIEEMLLERVKIGDLVIIGSGDHVPVDGTVISGNASLNQAAITGESVLSDKTIGDEVFSATLVANGSLVIRTEKIGNDTTLAKMILLVDEASRAKTKTETIADRFSTWYILGSLALSLIIYLITHNLTLILGLLLVTCADDIAVAIPLGFSIAISKAARHGIIIKGATVMEKLSNIKVFVTDKTGTLTRGITKVTDVITFGQTTEDELFMALGVCVSESKHPIALEIGRYLKEKGRTMDVPDQVHEQPGFGLSAEKNGHKYMQGKTTFLISEGIKIEDSAEEKIEGFQARGESVTAVAIDGRLAGMVVFEDQIRKHAREVIAETRQLGVKKWYMLTGDNEFVAERVSKVVEVDSYFANLKPEDKLAKIRQLKDKSGNIAMIGDGVNDAPALALADVSFAMGAIGSDVAVEAADIALMHDDLKRVPEAMLLSKETLRIVKQNFVIWVISNVVGLTLVFMGVIGPVGASIYNFLTDFIPIANVFQIWFLKINKHTYEVAERWR